ncbi:MAG: DNA starvation/stationary phase protection protein Dps [Opitutaceae bacterium]|nr:DNA starvation/stationary phase protection protein Dps [Opitutaceae bacterium]
MVWSSRHDLPETVRATSVGLLSQQLVLLIDLRLRAKQAHWNVKGLQFIALHELFDSIDDDVAELADDVAERAVALGGLALGTAEVVARESSLPPYDARLLAGGDHIRALGNSLAAVAKSARSAIDAAAEAGDLDTSDVFTQVSRALDKLLWKVEAHEV